MARLGAWELVEGWTPRADGKPHARLAPLLRAAAADEEDLGADTLGCRNQRLLAFHRDHVGGPLEAQVRCGTCGAQNEFLVPAGAILACPAPARGAVVRVGGARLRFPTMDDLAQVGSEAEPREALLARCRLSGPPVEAQAVEREYDRLDPAAAVAVAVACAECGAEQQASVDVAAFVAAALDRLVEGLILDVDRLARAYGWSERAILALPAERRRRYVALVSAAASGPARPRLVGGAG